MAVFAPHADDEVLGCGGTIGFAKERGGHVTTVITTVADIYSYAFRKLVPAETRMKEAEEASRILGTDEVQFFLKGFESRLDTIPLATLVSEFDKVLDKVRPTSVFLPFRSFHQDHQVVFDAAFAALRPNAHLYRNLSMVAVYEYPFASWAAHEPFRPSLYVDIEKHLDKKLAAIRANRSQVFRKGTMISPDMVKGWAEHRGREVMTKSAEAFELLRVVER